MEHSKKYILLLLLLGIAVKYLKTQPLVTIVICGFIVVLAPVVILRVIRRFYQPKEKRQEPLAPNRFFWW